MGGIVGVEKCITDVPDHLLLHIFKYLSAKDLCLCERLVCSCCLFLVY